MDFKILRGRFKSSSLFSPFLAGKSKRVKKHLLQKECTYLIRCFDDKKHAFSAILHCLTIQCLRTLSYL